MNLNIFKSQEEQVNQIVNDLAQTINNLLTQQKNVVLAVSGGKSPIAIFQKLSNLNLEWNRITITLCDERIVDKNNVDSNEFLVKNNLLINRARDTKFISLLNEEITEDKIITELANNILDIDIALLGMGEDGHTASIFPNCAELKSALDKQNQHNYIIVHPTTAKYSRVSLTLSGIVKIKHIMLSINGELKLNILKEAIKTKTKNYPISYVFDSRDDAKTYWYE